MGGAEDAPVSMFYRAFQRVLALISDAFDRR